MTTGGLELLSEEQRLRLATLCADPTPVYEDRIALDSLLELAAEKAKVARLETDIAERIALMGICHDANQKLHQQVARLSALVGRCLNTLRDGALTLTPPWCDDWEDSGELGFFHSRFREEAQSLLAEMEGLREQAGRT